MSDTWLESGLSPMAAKLQPSSILAIAAQVRAMVASGREICNLTIGDFKPAEYPIPERLAEACVQATRAGYTNYPPPNGIAELRQAVVDLYRARMGVEVDPSLVTVASGARPLLYATYRALVEPGDTVVYAVPSWNNDHYTKMLGGRAAEVEVDAGDHFFPRPDQIRPHLSQARLVALNSPLNPSGTCILREKLTEICTDIVAENERRKETGDKPLFLLYDQIYWMLTLGDIGHADPVSCVPEMTNYTVSVDGISKAFAATGMRVGWGVAPEPVSQAINRILGHVGAWAPHPTQRATVELLRDAAALDGYLSWIRKEAKSRLKLLYDRLSALGERLPIRAMAPEGAIYLSVEFALRGWKWRDWPLDSADEVRNFLLESSGMAVVPFDAFGAHHATDWYRLSVGAVSCDELDAVMTRLENACAELEGPGRAPSVSPAL